jgi:glycosyltransferase involved in cell wall biosynthesis
MSRRLLIINWRDTRNPEAGGAETYYHEIFRRLAARGFDVTVLAHAYAGGADHEDVDGLHVVRRGSRSLFNYAVIPFLRAHQHEFDLVIEDLNKIPFLTPLYVRRPRLHMVMHFFGSAIFREALLPLAAYVYGMEKLVPLAYRRERFVAISPSTRDEIVRSVGRGASVDVVEPGIDTTFFRPTLAKSTQVTLLAVTRLKKYKNVQFLIGALPTLRREAGDVALVVAGSGDYRPELERLARARGVSDHVRFEGYVTEERKRDLMSSATLFVNPSAKEGWGITTIEANACGTVSLASDVAGLRDSVRDGETGLLFAYGDQSAFVAQAARVLKQHALRRQMETQAAAFAATFCWDAMSRRMEKVILRCL